MSNVKLNNERNVIRLLLDVKNHRYVFSTFSFVSTLFQIDILYNIIYRFFNIYQKLLSKIFKTYQKLYITYQSICAMKYLHVDNFRRVINSFF